MTSPQPDSPQPDSVRLTTLEAKVVNHTQWLTMHGDTLASLEARFMDHTEGTNPADHENRLAALEQKIGNTRDHIRQDYTALDERLLQVEGMASTVTDLQDAVEALDVKLRAFERGSININGHRVDLLPLLEQAAGFPIPPDEAMLIPGPGPDEIQLRPALESEVRVLRAAVLEKNERIKHLEARIRKQKHANHEQHAILKEWKDDCAHAHEVTRQNLRTARAVVRSLTLGDERD